MWFVYASFLVNVLIIWFMPKRLTRQEIYVSWGIAALLNLSTDVIFDLYLRMYDLGPPGIQMSVHLMELTLGASYGVMFLNYMPEPIGRYLWYLVGWVAYSLLFEIVTIKIHFITYHGWKLWYSACVYIVVFLFLRWHLHFLRNESREKSTL